ncbi:MAG: IS1595 family transposase [Chloroflexi bacterium]|nr:IS1595 family transposase [Chloroflexota bacterium]
MKNMNVMKLTEQFHSEERCREVLEELRWPDGAVCPRCQGKQHARDSVRGVYDCYSCGYQFSVLAGTIFHDSKLPLRKWFWAVLLMVESRKGISANQMKRTLDVSYKTAWYLCHRIRAAMTETSPEPLSGTVEADETLVGGKRKNVGRGYRGNKTIVAGVVQRDGNVRMKVVNDTTRRTLHQFLSQHVKPDAQRIITDEWAAYKGIGDHDTIHETVNHHAGEYVRGDVHTNTVENVWSLLNRSIMGAYHHLSEKHLDAYLDELEWRYNNRQNPYLFRDTLMKLLHSEVLAYKELTAS